MRRRVLHGIVAKLQTIFWGQQSKAMRAQTFARYEKSADEYKCNWLLRIVKAVMMNT